MHVIVLRSHEIDQETWDNFILGSREGNIYATYTYLQHCERVWKAAILLDEHENYLAVMPFQVRKVYGIEYIYQDPFARELGIYTRRNLTHVQYNELLKASLKSYRYVARYHFNVDNYSLLKQDDYLPEGFLSAISTYHLDLRKSYKEIYDNYRYDRKYSIRRANRYEQHIVGSTDVEQALNIFRQVTFHKIPGLNLYQIELKKRLYAHLVQLGLMEVYYVSYNNSIIAAALIVKYNKKVVYLFGSNSKLAFQIRSSSLLIDHIIQKYAGQDLIFDFEGGEVQSLGNFYASFGAESRIIYTYEKNTLPKIVSLLMKSRKKIIQKLKNNSH
ncbi:hypothetical protein OKW21_006474 [Catalinimonas alkaloidigena]|uniref:GNAT family N-acetyltransferase n=1 Tax=Catalinimonas alkaloidigena TaxID=1075417 RepID=UPI002406E0F5|nr:GNAT family N-acetyltransferase [Catalinimonas alkaloidigena]MDF9801211.1 hypothetical protein [Catalinimonas alkaloidigena]